MSTAGHAPRWPLSPSAALAASRRRAGTCCKYGSELIWLLSDPSEQSGSVDILGMLNWLVNNGYLPQKSGLTAISYGFEICSTGGKPETFTVSRFSLSAP